MTNKSNDYLKNGIKAGLSAKSAAVYVALLEAGVSLSPKGLIARTRLHRQYVYDALHELQDRQLIITSGEKRRIKYGAVSPDRLLQEVEKQRIDTLDGVRNLMKLYERSPAGVVEVIRGSQAVIESELAMLRDAKQGDFLDIVGGAGMNWVKLFEGRIPEWEALRKEKNIKLRYIGTGEDVRHNKEESIIENESRAIPGIGNIVNVSIRPESVSFYIYEPEIVTVKVKNAAAVASQRTLFEVLWNVAK
ncbi:MAG: TrmB family transcriptional regulator [Minisyncoccota bacterium]